MRRVRAALAWILVGAGCAALAYPALAYGTSTLRQARLSAEVRTLIGRGTPASASVKARPPATTSAASAVRPVEGQPLGAIAIPAVGLDAVFLEGASEEVLMTGPGHLPGTVLPGTRGVSVLAAHRDMHFRNLKDVRVGDRVTLRLPTGPVAYRVTRRDIAAPDEQWVTAPRRSSILRLVTCWPPDFIGPAPERLIVTAVPVERHVETTARSDRPSSGTPSAAPLGRSVSLAPGDTAALPVTSLPPIGTVGATAAGLAAFGASRTRRRLAWWFLPWLGGLGVVALVLLAAWGGPGFSRLTHIELAAQREVLHADAPRGAETGALGPGLYRVRDVVLAGPAMDAFLAAERLLGFEIELTGSVRTHAQQAAAHAAKPGLAAPPGSSMHELGLGIDVDTGFLDTHPQVRDALLSVGWRQFDPVRERWHFSFGRAG